MISSNVLQRPAPPAAQPAVDIASLNINVPVPPAVPAPVAALNAGRDRDPQLVRRVRELEDEVRNLRAENEKQVCQSSLCAPTGLMMMTCPSFAGAESDDRPFPRAVGEAEGVCEAEEGGEGRSGDYERRWSEDRRGSRGGGGSREGRGCGCTGMNASTSSPMGTGQ